MLQAEYGGGHEESHLLAVRNCLESGPDGYFGLSEAYIAAHQTVHRAAVLHIPFYGYRGALLVRSVLVHKRRLELFLQVGVGREGEALGSASFGIQGYEFLCYVLDLRFGSRLEVLPGLASEFVDFGRQSVLGAVFRNLVQKVNRHEDHVAVLVGDFYHFLEPAAVVPHLHQTSEHSYTVVDVDYVVAYIEGVQVIDCQLFALLHGAAYADPLEAVEDFVVRVAADLAVGVDEAVVDDLTLDKFGHQAGILYQNGFEPLGLGSLVGEDFDLESFLDVGAYVGSEKLEILIEYRLGRDVESHLIFAFNAKGSVEEYGAQLFHPGKGRGVGVHVE